jgi:hypothetical protein
MRVVDHVQIAWEGRVDARPRPLSHFPNAIWRWLCLPTLTAELGRRQSAQEED